MYNNGNVKYEIYNLFQKKNIHILIVHDLHDI